MKYLAILLFFVFSCDATIDNSQKKTILKILGEMEKIQEQLITKSSFIPDTNALLVSVKEAELSFQKNKDIKAELGKLELILSKVDRNDKEAFFESISSFSEKITDILNANKIQTEYHKFYCPMVQKYWIAKGEKIQNPYAPEMRECGELVK